LLFREAKLKSKQKNVQEEQIAILGDEDSDGEEPDLSWLPDPDKIYGKENSGSESGEDEGERTVAMDSSDMEDNSEEVEDDSNDAEKNSESEDEPQPKRYACISYNHNQAELTSYPFYALIFDNFILTFLHFICFIELIFLFFIKKIFK